MAWFIEAYMHHSDSNELQTMHEVDMFFIFLNIHSFMCDVWLYENKYRY